MTMTQKHVLILALLSTLLAAQSGPVRATDETPLAQRPLFMTPGIKPNLIITVDAGGEASGDVRFDTDPGTATWAESFGFFQSGDVYGIYPVGTGDYEIDNRYTVNNYDTIFPDDRNTSIRAIPPLDQYGFARSPEFNKLYFDPSKTYKPWKRENGDYWDDAIFADASFDPRSSSSTHYNLGLFGPFNNTQNRTTRSFFSFAYGMLLPTGTKYWVPSSLYGEYTGCDYLGNGKIEAPDDEGDLLDTWNTLDSTDDEVNEPGGRSMSPSLNDNAPCIFAIQFQASVFFLKKGGALEKSTAALGYKDSARTLVADACGAGCDMYKYGLANDNNFDSTAEADAMRQNFANWFSYHRTYALESIATLREAFVNASPVRAGIIGSLGGSTPIPMYDLSVNSDRTSFYTAISNAPGNLDSGEGLRHRDTLDVIGQEFMRTTGTPIVQAACQTNFAMVYNGTGETNNRSITTTVGNADGAESAPYADNYESTLADIAMYYYNTNLRPDLTADQVPVVDACSVSPLDPSLDCNTNPHLQFLGVTAGNIGMVYNVNSAATSDPYNTTFDWPPNAVNEPQCFDLENCMFYNTDWLEAPPIDDLWHAALNSHGKFFSNAANPESLSDALGIVVSTISDHLTSGTMVLTGAREGSNTFTVTPSFSVSNSDWTGEVTADNINSDGTTTQRWTAAKNIPAYGSRNILVVTSPGVYGVGADVDDFELASSLGSSTDDQFDSLGLSSAEVAAYIPSATPQEVINYLRGDQSKEIKNGDYFRNRSGLLGDIVNSTPEISSPTDDYGYTSMAGEAGTKYKTFLSNKKNNMTAVFVGANDGMLHAFDGDTGKEVFGFIPNGVLKKPDDTGIGELALPSYSHAYYVDGQIAISDVYDGFKLTSAQRKWHTMLVGTAGAGGKSIFGIDITSLASTGGNALSTSSRIWEVNSSTDVNVGNVLGKPAIVPMKVANPLVEGTFIPTAVTIVPNGYNSGTADDDADADPVLLVLDTLSGAVLATVPAVDSAATDAFSVSVHGNNGLGQVVVLDEDNNGYADTVYAGDLKGNLWKFINPTEIAVTTSWSVAYGGVPVFTATDRDGVVQPITGGIEVTPGPNGRNMVFFGTGRYLSDADNSPGSDPQIQSFYGILDDPDKRHSGVALNRDDDLWEQTITSTSTVTDDDDNIYESRATSQNSADFLSSANNSGWYIDFIVDPDTVGTGEMFIGTPTIQSGIVFFNTFDPGSETCLPGGKNWLYGLSTLSGVGRLSGISSGSTKVCTSNCGAIATATGAPARSVAASIPASGTLYNVATAETCDGTDPDCVELADPSTGGRCNFHVNVAGQAMTLPRPCGRQSWRQLR